MIEEFIAQVKGEGLARTNRYTVFFNPPASLSAIDSDLRKVLLYCDQVQLPGMNYSTVQNRTFGEFRETPYEKLYDAINLSFYVDNNLRVKWLFDTWLNSVQDFSSRTFNYYNQYITDMQIVVVDLQNKQKYGVTLFECYPKNIGSVQLDNASKDIMKIQVTMQYKFWTANPVETVPDGSTVSTEDIEAYKNDFTGFQDSIAFNQTGGGGASALNPETSGSSVLGNYGVGKLPGQMI